MARLADNGTTWSVLDDTVLAWKNWAGSDLKPCALNLWKAAGFLRFALPVLGIPLAKLGRIVKMQSDTAKTISLQSRRDYNCEHETLIAPMNQVKELIKKLSFAPQNPKSHLKKMRAGFKPTYFATDATELLESYETFAYGATFEKCNNKHLSDHRTSLEVNNILGSEAAAQAWRIRKWANNEFREESNPFAVSGGDNQAVLISFNKGWSRHAEVDKHIVSVEDVISFQTIIYVDIPSGENFADIRTRPNEIFSPEEIVQRRNNSWTRLSKAWHLFKQSRQTIFMREQTTHEHEEDEEFEIPMLPPDEDDIEREIEEETLNSKKRRRFEPHT